MQTSKLCKRCNIEKPVTEFGKRSDTKSGLKSHCKSCISIKAKEHYEKTDGAYHKSYIVRKQYEIYVSGKKYREKNADKIRENKRLYYQATKHTQSRHYVEIYKVKCKAKRKRKFIADNIYKLMLASFNLRKCSSCGAEKHISDYYYNTNNNNYQGKCKSCQKADRDRNKKKRKEWAKNYREVNKSLINAQKNEYHKRRAKECSLFRLKVNLRSRTRSAFKYHGYKNGSATHDLLGASWIVVKKHIERQFLPGMTWDNYGKWHIDHIIPLAKAKTRDDLIKLCHYRNLQPLWAIENVVKQDKILQPIQMYLPI